jgi:hypothetical protein
MSRQVVLLPSNKPFGNIQALTFCCAFLVFSSTSHAENTNDATAKLTQLGYTTGEIAKRVENYRVDGWNYLDDKHILIYAGPSRRFLITTLADCPQLNWAEHIGFTSTTSYLTKLDKLVVGVTNCRAPNFPKK